MRAVCRVSIQNKRDLPSRKDDRRYFENGGEESHPHYQGLAFFIIRDLKPNEGK